MCPLRRHLGLFAGQVGCAGRAVPAAVFAVCSLLQEVLTSRGAAQGLLILPGSKRKNKSTGHTDQPCLLAGSWWGYWDEAGKDQNAGGPAAPGGWRPP